MLSIRLEASISESANTLNVPVAQELQDYYHRYNFFGICAQTCTQSGILLSPFVLESMSIYAAIRGSVCVKNLLIENSRGMSTVT
jgi:hypothetical protein